MSEASPLDERGRITIRREYRDRLGERVAQVLTPHGVLLRPVPDELDDRDDLPDAFSDGEDRPEKGPAPNWGYDDNDDDE